LEDDSDTDDDADAGVETRGPEPIRDIRWAAEQMKAGHKVKRKDGINIYSLGKDERILKDGRHCLIYLRQLLATDWELVQPEPAERKCGNCKQWLARDKRAYLEFDTCRHDYALRVHRESIACKDFEQK
jgi:hypothetical protein